MARNDNSGRIDAALHRVHELSPSSTNRNRIKSTGLETMMSKIGRCSSIGKGIEALPGLLYGAIK